MKTKLVLNLWSISFCLVFATSLLCSQTSFREYVTAETQQNSLTYDRFKNWHLKDGLPDRDLISCISDQDGFYWFASANYVSRFNGEGFTTYFSVEDFDETTELDIEKIFRGPAQDIYILFSGNTSLYVLINSKTYEVELKTVSLPDEVTQLFGGKAQDLQILQIYDDTLRLSTVKENGVRLRFRIHTDTMDLKARLIHSVGNKWWFYAPGKVWTVSQDLSIITYNLPSMLRPTLIHVDALERIWVSFRNRGIVYMAEAQDEMFHPVSGVPNYERYNGIFSDQSGNVLISIRSKFLNTKGYYLISPSLDVKSANFIAREGSLITDLVSKNLENAAVFATINGVYQGQNINTQVRTFFDQKIGAGQWGTVLKGIASNHHGKTFVAKEFDGIYEIDKVTGQYKEIRITFFDSIHNRYLPLSCSNQLVFVNDSTLIGSTCDEDQNAFLYSYDIIHGEANLYFHSNNKLINDFVYDAQKKLIYIIFRNNHGGGIFDIFNTETQSFVHFKDSLCNEVLKDRIPISLALDSSGLVWIGMDKGVLTYDPFSLKMSMFDAPDPGLEQVAKIGFSSKGDILVGTNKGFGIFSVNDKTTWINRSTGLVNDNVVSFEEDRNGNFWISTFEGIALYNTKDQILSNYNTSVGFSHNEFNRLSSMIDEEGLLYFGGMNGLNVFAPESFLNQSKENQILLSGLTKLNKTQGLVNLDGNQIDGQIVFRPNDIYLQLAFYIEDHLDSRNYLLAYQLSGTNQTWIYQQGNTIRLEKMPPGSYNLTVKSLDLSGNWNGSIYETQIKTRDFFYKNPWFYIGLLVFVAIGSYFVIKTRTKIIRKREEEKTLINKKFAELELQALQAQMNPHFIFNSLSTIQYFIHSNDRASSEKYINRFATLIRSFLEASKNKFVTLAEELKILKLYIELEQIRFKNHFTVALEIDPELNLQLIQVPAMLLQPFVENAINHGLFHKKHIGHLTIIIKEIEEDKIECRIIDDGIGREKAKVIRKKSLKNYQSRGTQITKERIDVLNMVSGYDFDLEVKDLHPSINGSDVGTEVVLTFTNFD